MSKIIKDTTNLKRIKAGKTAEKISQETFREGISGEAVEDFVKTPSDPVSFFILHNRLLHEIKSTGGRPGRVDATVRRKISMSDQEWKDLEEIADVFADLGVKTSPGQVASFLLENSTQKIKNEIKNIEKEAEGILSAAAHSNTDLAELKPVAEELLKQMKIKRIVGSLKGLKSVAE